MRLVLCARPSCVRLELLKCRPRASLLDHAVRLKLGFRKLAFLAPFFARQLSLVTGKALKRSVKCTRHLSTARCSGRWHAKSRSVEGHHCCASAVHVCDVRGVEIYAGLADPEDPAL